MTDMPHTGPTDVPEGFDPADAAPEPAGLPQNTYDEDIGESPTEATK